MLLNIIYCSNTCPHYGKHEPFQNQYWIYIPMSFQNLITGICSFLLRNATVPRNHLHVHTYLLPSLVSIAIEIRKQIKHWLSIVHFAICNVSYVHMYIDDIPLLMSPGTLVETKKMRFNMRMLFDLHPLFCNFISLLLSSFSLSLHIYTYTHTYPHVLCILYYILYNI